MTMNKDGVSDERLDAAVAVLKKSVIDNDHNLRRLAERVLLAADRRAPAVVTVDEIAQLIREVDGDNTMGARQLAEALLGRLVPAALSVRAEPVAVKPLEWRDHRGHTFPDTWTALSPLGGVFEIEERSAGDSPAYVASGPNYTFIADKDSLDEAKAAAEADYEQRIRSALLASPTPSIPAGYRLVPEEPTGRWPTREEAASAASVLLRCNGFDLDTWGAADLMDDAPGDALKALAAPSQPLVKGEGE